MFERFAHWVSVTSGHPVVFGAACACIVLWAICGPFFHFSDTWQLIINTSTTIVTFLMVFLIQNTQARDTLMIKLQLGEIIRALNEADNRMITLDGLSEAQLDELLKVLQQRTKQA